MLRRESGFTLIEIAIVLVIIGLLLGGVLKGQELITSARVRNIISQQDGVKAAFFGFQDRFRAIPGDYSQASINIATGLKDGNGNGQVESMASGGGGDEYIAVWEHLSRSGFINGSYAYAPAPPTTASNLSNPYGMFLVLIYDNLYAGSNPTRHNLKTGNQIPADILAEVDRKVDDGRADVGVLRFSTHVGLTVGTPPTPTRCFDAATGAWLVVGGTVETNCGATSLF